MSMVSNNDKPYLTALNIYDSANFPSVLPRETHIYVQHATNVSSSCFSRMTRDNVCMLAFCIPDKFGSGVLP